MKKNDKKNEKKVEEKQMDAESTNNESTVDENESIEVETKEETKTENNSAAEEKSDAQKLEDCEKQIAELKDTLLRKVAEFENYKRRNENDQANLFKYAAESFIISILPVYDDFERSMGHINDQNNVQSVKDGIKMVFEKFSKILEDHGVKKIEAKGKPFDFNFHEALMQREEESVPPHTVLEEIEGGYMYKDKVLRHSKVIVSQESAAGPQEEKSSSEENSSEDNN